MPEPLNLTDLCIIADNTHGWCFCVAKLNSTRWVGFAAPPRSLAEKAFASEGLPVDPQMLMIFPEVSEGYRMGVLDRDLAIRMTGAVAQDPESCYGGIERWHVPEELRGKPEDFRCERCERIGCDGRECREDYSGEDYP